MERANLPLFPIRHSPLAIRYSPFAPLGNIMGEFAIGQSVLRREDPRLLRGQGRFFDDLKLAEQLHAAIVRSPHAHADIAGIETRTACELPGVQAVLTGEDYRTDALG